MTVTFDQNQPIWIASDHGGYAMKKALFAWLTTNRYQPVDCGCKDEGIVRYPFYAAKVAAAVSDGRAARGILICSTGIGMSIAANKFPGVRAALCMDPYMAKMTRKHNDSNILCLGGMTIGLHLAQDIWETWLTTEFIGDRHMISLNLIQALEAHQFARDDWSGRDEEEYPF